MIGLSGKEAYAIYREISMKRRDFVKGTAVSGAAVLGAPAIVKAKETFRLKLVTTWPPKYPILQDAPEIFAKKVKIATEGRVKIKVYAAGELIPALGVFEAVSQGTVDMGVGYPAYWAGKIPATQVMGGVPFGMNAQQVNAWMIDGGGQEIWENMYKPVHLHPITFGYVGSQMAGWFKKEIKSVADLKGLKMRMPGLAGKVLAKAGSNIVLMAGGELYTALERGTIDATEWVGPYLDERLGLHRAASYYYYPGWHDPTGMLELITNSKVWEKLPEDIQTIIHSVAQDVGAWMVAKHDAENSRALQKIKQKKDVKILKLPDDVISALRVHSKTVMKELSAEDKQFREAYDSYQTFQKQINSYFEIGNYAYGALVSTS